MNTNTFKMMIAALTEDDLAELGHLVFLEQDRRNTIQIQSGKTPEMNQIEKEIAVHSPIDAIKAYRNRTACTLLLAKRVVDKFRDENS